MDSTGQTIDFLLTAKRDAAAAKRFFSKALSSPGNPLPRVINVDKNRAFPAAVAELKTEKVPAAPRATASVWSRGVTRWFRCGLSVAGPFVCRCLTSPSCSVSTPRSSNRTGAFRASGSRRKVHDFAHGKLRGRAVRRTNPSTLWRWTSGNRPVPIPPILCLAHSH